MAFNSKLALLVLGAAVAVSSTAGAQSTDWANRISLNGDARFRLQRDFIACNTVASGSCQSSDNYYGRMRFRLGVTGTISDSLSAIARLSTGANQYATQFNLGTAGTALGTGYSQRQSFTLDRAYFKYKVANGIVAEFGKVPVSFFVGGNTYEIWNFDQGFEGLQLLWNGDMGSMKTFAT